MFCVFFFLSVLLIIKLVLGRIAQGNEPAIIELNSLLVCMVYKYGLRFSQTDLMKIQVGSKRCLY